MNDNNDIEIEIFEAKKPPSKGSEAEGMAASNGGGGGSRRMSEIL